MKTKNIFKMLAFAMLMPTILLSTACSNEDDVVNNDNNKKGYEIPVTINVTRQGDATTRASYNDGTKKLSFSAGDKLFVRGHDESSGGPGSFAGTLEWQSGGTFSGTLKIQNDYTGNIENLLTSASSSGAVTATLLPAGYETYGCFTIYTPGTTLASAGFDYNNALTTTKATAIEQFSLEMASEYNNGFALSPNNAILNFTITELPPNTYVNVSLVGAIEPVYGTVATDGSGTATFVVGIVGGKQSQYLILTVGGAVIPLNLSGANNRILEAGKIYNITRSDCRMAAAAEASDRGKLICTDGHIHAYGAVTACTKDRVALITYVGSSTGGSYNHGLALALNDEVTMDWSTAVSSCLGKTPTVTDAYWMLPSKDQWNTMISAATTYTALRDGFSSKGGVDMTTWYYWSETGSGNKAWCIRFSDGSWQEMLKTSGTESVRACLVF